MNNRSIIGGILLVVVLLSGWALLRERQKPLEVTVDDGTTDYVLHDFQIVALDDQGKESTTLRAPKLERTRADQTVAIATPVFEMPDDQGQHWTLRADTGWLSPKGDELKLQGNVSGDSPTTGNTPPTTFRTTHLDVFPKDKKARTDARVTMTRPGMEQAGTGFEVDSAANTYRFLSSVKSRYTPTAR
ncbi:LPS export ABC transporter periplasmic protein LptC [Stenotrophomonas sp. C3(2023)]|uniref:LPS export ABC transporter periplasmic protein LptC n=1 Tax=Stenotrophomonas sp. C3(2023) TaxID=3080277 RepID=UPI00293C8179|nr:LPS export ABC transporter periplasmic protein LptC [Stenotrophomonas sp. C3(2023)]MDV3467870.1 LPS export ABC transporter periplasmic protein LptC [Stenotrophomonas sp. C3(2023)]